jgi:hypothetical protein
MALKRSVHPSAKPAVYSVRIDDKVAVDKNEHEAWGLFLKWCAHVTHGTRVELLKDTKVVARLESAGTRPSHVVLSGHDAPAAAVA